MNIQKELIKKYITPLKESDYVGVEIELPIVNTCYPYIVNSEMANQREKKDANVVEEHMQVGQGNLVIGLDINCQKPNEKYIASVYNAILGGGANSKLFQNVREKQSLAYTANSSYVRTKNSIFIRSRN